MKVVIDASVMVKYLVSEGASDAAVALMRQPVWAPDLLIAECLNALKKKVIRNEISADLGRLAVEALQRTPIILEASQPLAARAFELSLQLGHSVYDCVYLAMAQQLGGVLVSADEQFVARCQREADSEIASRVRSLRGPLPAATQERTFRPYMARRAA